jgi:aminopeptidase N
MVRGLGWVTLWDAVLEGELEPVTWYELLLRGVEAETEEQNLERVLDYLDATFWGLLPEDQREARAGQTERVLRSRMLADSEMTVRAALFRTWRSVALEAIWAGERSIPGLDLSEDDFTALAAELALRAAPDADRILEEQVTRIENPDRRARFEFLRPALSADEGVREAFFESLGSAENREHEPWVLAGLGYLHHPLRRGHARRFVRPSLDLVLEIQRTGDIFFPTRWLAANLGSHSDPEIVEQIEAFLDTLPGNYPDRLEGKILQAADGVFRRARILHGTDH